VIKKRRHRDSVRFPAGSLIFLLHAAARTPLGSIQHPLQGVSRAISPGVEWLGDGFDMSFTSSGEVKNACSYTYGPLYVFMLSWLINLRDDSPSAYELPGRSEVFFIFSLACVYVA
jgi:hypothetical protein